MLGSPPLLSSTQNCLVPLLPMSTTTEGQTMRPRITGPRPLQPPHLGRRLGQLPPLPGLWVSLPALPQGLSPSQRMTQRRSPLLRPGLQDSLSPQGTLRKGF